MNIKWNYTFSVAITQLLIVILIIINVQNIFFLWKLVYILFMYLLNYYV